VVGQNYGCGRKRHVHTKRHDNDGEEGLDPVSLLNLLSGGNDSADAKGAHGDEHDEGDRCMAEHEAGHAGSDKTGDDDRGELCRGGERCVPTDGLEKAKAVEDPDSEGAPAKRHAAKYEVHRPRHGVYGQNRVFSPLINPPKGDKAHHAHDEQKVDVWGSPAVEGLIVPSDVDEDEASYSNDRARQIEAGGFHGFLAEFVWHNEESEKRKKPTDDCETPECPRPPQELGEQATKSDTSNETRRSNSTKNAKHRVLPNARGISETEKSETVGYDQSRTYALHGRSRRRFDVEAQTPNHK